MPTIYLETTIISYLAAYPSRDLIVAAHQQISHDWWHDARGRYDLYISETVMEEIRSGDPDAATRRLEIVEGLPVLVANKDVRNLVQEYGKPLGLAGSAKADLPHFAYAVAYEMDYLLTWNCRHIANGEVIRRLMGLNAGSKRSTPLIITPEELLESPEEDES